MPELQNDSVEEELHKEVKLLQETETFLSHLLEDLQEQLRKHRSTVFSMERDLLRKTTTLKSEKHNELIKLSDEFETHAKIKNIISAEE